MNACVPDNPLTGKFDKAFGVVVPNIYLRKESRQDSCPQRDQKVMFYGKKIRQLMSKRISLM